MLSTSQTRIDGTGASMCMRLVEAAALNARAVDQGLHYMKQDWRDVFKFAVKKAAIVHSASSRRTD